MTDSDCFWFPQLEKCQVKEDEVIPGGGSDNFVDPIITVDGEVVPAMGDKSV